MPTGAPINDAKLKIVTQPLARHTPCFFVFYSSNHYALFLLLI